MVLSKIYASTSSENLTEAAKNNLKTLKKNSEEAFSMAIKIEREAKKTKVAEAEMWALITQCEFQEIKNNYKALNEVALRLESRAISYDLPVYRSIAKYYFFHNYYYNEMYDKALDELNQGLDLLEKISSPDKIANKAKRNLLVAYSNYHLINKDYEKQIFYLNKIIKEIENTEDQKDLFYLHYANLGGAYFNMNKPEKAERYIELSFQNKTDKTEENIDFLNFLTLGKIELKRNDFYAAIKHFENALALQGHVNYYNKIELINHMIEAQELIKNQESVEYYTHLRDSVLVQDLQSKNQFLQIKANKNTEYKDKKNFFSISVALLFLVVISLSMMKMANFYKPVLITQPEINIPLKEESAPSPYQQHLKLINLLEQNDSAFLSYFDQVYPNFSKNLFEHNPKLVLSEIEFCALLKLKLSSKEIAKYKYITHKTVQNRKYRIRRKLNIPQGMDIYHWFEKL